MRECLCCIVYVYVYVSHCVCRHYLPSFLLHLSVLELLRPPLTTAPPLTLSTIHTSAFGAAGTDAQLERRLGRAGAGGYSTARASTTTSSSSSSSSNSGSGSGGAGADLAYSSAPLVAAARETGAPLAAAAAEPDDSTPPRLGLAERLHLRRQQGGGVGGGLGGARGLGGVSISSVSGARARLQAGQRGVPGEDATGPCGLGLGKLDF